MRPFEHDIKLMEHLMDDLDATERLFRKIESFLADSTKTNAKFLADNEQTIQTVHNNLILWLNGQEPKTTEEQEEDYDDGEECDTTPEPCDEEPETNEVTPIPPQAPTITSAPISDTTIRVLSELGQQNSAPVRLNWSTDSWSYDPLGNTQH